MLAKILKRAGIGFLIGVVLGNAIAILTGDTNANGVTFASPELLRLAGGSGIVSMLLQSLFSGIYGALCFDGTLLYDIERLPLAAATALHCAIIIVPFIPISLLLGWFKDFKSLLIMSCIQLAVFFVIWLVLYFVYKKQVRELNEMQRNLTKK